jgi:hypothetical protein
VLLEGEVAQFFSLLVLEGASSGGAGRLCAARLAHSGFGLCAANGAASRASHYPCLLKTVRRQIPP